MGNNNILIIDDDRELRDQLAELLEDEGYVVSTTYSAESGLKLLKEAAYPLLLLDLKLPGMQGEEMLLIVKRAYPQMKVMIISGRPMYCACGDTTKPEEDLALSDCIMGKPFSIPNLLDKVSSLMPHRESGRRHKI